ncbi:MAG TPA: hypothetical protein VH206_17290 [Xanthobacteraceae bacterium]|nr:hypothetical protein [Xanthobacteraceae bacterium]
MIKEDSGDSVVLSPQALILYKQMLDDTVFIKRQQWAVTNYTALIYAGIIWFAHNLSPPPKTSCILSGFSILAGAVSIGILIWFQCDLSKLRMRIANTNNYAFGKNEKRGFVIKHEDNSPFARGGHILGALIMVCLSGALLAVFALT